LNRSPVRKEKGAVQAHQQELEQRVKPRPRAMPAGEREREHGQPEHAGEQHEEGREPVGHEHDAERRRPVAEAVDLRGGSVDEPQQGDRGGHQEERRGDADHGLEGLPALVEQQHQRARGERQHHRHDDEVLRPSAHSSGSLPST
jgi:hypothetical protein